MLLNKKSAARVTIQWSGFEENSSGQSQKPWKSLEKGILGRLSPLTCHQIYGQAEMINLLPVARRMAMSQCPAMPRRFWWWISHLPMLSLSSCHQASLHKQVTNFYLVAQWMAKLWQCLSKLRKFWWLILSLVRPSPSTCHQASKQTDVTVASLHAVAWWMARW